MGRAMSDVPLVALRCRSDRSFGLSTAAVPKMVARLKALGCTAAGIVDYNGTWAYRAWERECAAALIKALYGVELNVLGAHGRPTMWWLARNRSGVQALYRATTLANSRSPTHLTETEAQQLSNNGDVIAFAGGVTNPALIDACNAFPDVNDTDIVVRLAHSKYAQRSSDEGRPIVYASKNAYVLPEDLEIHTMITNERYVGKMHVRVDRDTAGIAAMCEDVTLPRAEVIRIENDSALLREDIARGKVKRISTGRVQWSDEYERRLERELELIEQKKFCSYFLIVGELTRWAKEQGILVGPSRGSSAGSLACYLLEITEIDPIPPRLMFERFIDVSRSDLPDIDIDFPDTRRAEVIAHIVEKYGHDRVGGVGTISELKPKSAIGRIGARARIPFHVTEQLKQLFANRGAAQARSALTVEEVLEGTELGAKLSREFPVLRLASGMVGCATHRGKHAAGVIVTPTALTDYCSVNADGSVQLDKIDAEELGLLKIDVLGLRTLGILQDARVQVDWYGLPLDDPSALNIYRAGRLSGIFQFEGRALRTLTGQIKVESINHIDAITALARPGPLIGGVTPKYVDRMNGVEKVEALHPMVAEYMEDTYGLPLYQEQTMNIVRHLGNFSWEKTSFVRKAISKRKGEDAFIEIEKDFFAGCAENKIPSDVARSTWRLIKTMGAWQMNKSHTYSYAVLSYWTAWLKAHHPLEFVAAQLRGAKDDSSAIDILRESVEQDGIKYVPFDIDRSTETWHVHGGVLYGGWQQLHGFGPALAARAVAARERGELSEALRTKALNAKNPFVDLYPVTGEFSHLYASPREHGIAANKIFRLDEFVEGELDQGREYVFIARINAKDIGDENEAVRVRKRGYELRGDTRILTLHLQDDSAMINARISRFDFARLGAKIYQDVPEGSVCLWRAKFFGGHRFAFITKYKVLKNG